ncbi:haloacid dehalogenase [Pseudoclavibacter endophyticus]|uniref:D,D-heptose 1,7-bisphosphate phosphatase n=1 Tax=Pseudoclavibacter endophyticus TaxID=1778590 RepID=A0A6H9WQA0_9MICO|nr:HAD-IIIA family hydrolase [Pseudoclavibacter endophyticus]KAB1650308.1 HAD-IIIA family hydrolase [Pseudoclavibacter endophyticus]GGA55256.1 haloacid dehalogenase [Pseudoclavibacter endophyticus]
MRTQHSFAIVIPSVGRPSLDRLLDTIAALATDEWHPGPVDIVIVDDRRAPAEGEAPLAALTPAVGGAPVRVVRGYGRGPAAARNRGWRAIDPSVEWIAFLDDDVELPATWARELAADLAACPPEAGASQGRIVVPLPEGRRPTDWERNTASLQDAEWATADMAYRRSALDRVGGFDERFPRAYREDADLAVRVRRAGYRLERGNRHILHPVRPADDWVSHRVQAGNADNALMRRLHGPQWRELARAPGGAFGWHVATTVAAAVAVAGTLGGLAGRRGAGRLAGAGALAWAGLYGRFLRLRMAPGPQPGDPEFRPELRRMSMTSATIPPVAVWHRLRGWLRHRATGPWPVRPRAVLFDRDGTIVHDVPYNGDPQQVRPVDGAGELVQRVRAAGLRTAVITNQSGVARGIVTRDQVDAVNARVDDLLGPFDSWQICPHGPAEHCACRKPQPGMVLAAAHALGVRPEECVVIGDIGADVEAAQSAGARSVLVPTPVTRQEEIADAPVTAPDLATAVELVLSWASGVAQPPSRPRDGDRSSI